MLKKTIKCPNCNGPVKPNPKEPMVSCGYCNHHFENPVYRDPVQVGGTQPAAGAPTISKRVVIIVLISTLLPILVGLIFALTRVSNHFKTQPLKPVSPHRPSEPLQVALPPDIALENKLDKYIECLECSFPWAETSMESYRSLFKDPQKGPTCKERYVNWGLNSMDEDAPKMCRELVESANAAAPAIPPLHQVASSFAVAVARLEPVMRAVAHYFDKKQYALDDCAKAQALHPQLMALYQELDVQHQMLRQHLEHYATGTLKRCLDRTAANPEMAGGHYWANLIVRSEETVALFRAEAKKDKPDLDAMKRQTALLNEAAAALNALSDQHKQAAGYSYESNVNNFIEGAMAFLASKGGKKLNSSARFFRRTGTPLVRLEGTLEYFLSRYNKVLDDYKQNQFCGQLLPCDKTRCPVR